MRPSPAVASLLRGENDLATYVELETERTRRRPAANWAAAAAVAVALGGVAVAQPWDSGGNTPTAATVTAPVETTAFASSTSLAPATTTEPIVRTTVDSPPATAAAVTVPPVTEVTRPKTEPPSTTAKARPPETPTTTVAPPPPPPAGLEQAKAQWRECATRGQQEGLTQEQIAARCGTNPTSRGTAGPHHVESCMKESPRGRADRVSAVPSRPGGVRLRAARLVASALTDATPLGVTQWPTSSASGSEAVVAVAAEVGLAHISMAEVLERADISAGDVYRHFPGGETKCWWPQWSGSP